MWAEFVFPPLLAVTLISVIIFGLFTLVRISQARKEGTESDLKKAYQRQEHEQSR
jgi:hypothetical protein